MTRQRLRSQSDWAIPGCHRVKNSTPEPLTSMSPSSLMPQLALGLTGSPRRGHAERLRSHSEDFGARGAHKQTMKACEVPSLLPRVWGKQSPQGSFTFPSVSSSFHQHAGSSLCFREQKIPFSDVRSGRLCILWGHQVLYCFMCPAWRTM